MSGMKTQLFNLVLAISLFSILVIWLYPNQVYSQTGDCDPSYPDVCIASAPPDLNCPDVPDKRFTVLPSDPHGFDRDADGVGCES
jgi:micrococcal nuclease